MDQYYISNANFSWKYNKSHNEMNEFFFSLQLFYVYMGEYKIMLK